MKRDHSAYFEYFTEPPEKGSKDWTWSVLVHRIPAVTKEIRIDCASCRATGLQKCPPDCQLRCEPGKHPCSTCQGSKTMPNKISVPEELKGSAPDEASARTAAQKAGAEALKKHLKPKEGK